MKRFIEGQSRTQGTLLPESESVPIVVNTLAADQRKNNILCYWGFAHVRCR
jgi:hypothetical protein